MLGGLRIEVNGKVLSDNINRSHKLWSLLCYLIINRDRNIPRAELIEQFWPGESQANPANALKTLLHRIRLTLEPIFGLELSPIISRGGTCTWNPDIHCTVDIEQFQVYYQQAQAQDIDTSARLALYARAASVYRDDLLPKLQEYLWVISLQAHYHALYISMVKSYAALLEEEKRFQDMYAICNHATRIEPLDDELYYLLITALVKQGEAVAALNQYEAAVEQLYRSLGVRPSAHLRALYNDIMKLHRTPEVDIEQVEEDLCEAMISPGAYVCEYGFFKVAYQLDARRMQRGGVSVHIAMLTLSFPDQKIPSPVFLDAQMKQIQSVLVSSLRLGDIVSRYSETQYIVLLHAANYENSIAVLERILKSFYQQCNRPDLTLTYKIRELNFVT